MANYRGDSSERDSGSSRRYGSSSSSYDSSRRGRDRRSDWSRDDDEYDRGSSRRDSYGTERGYGYPPIVYDGDRPSYGTQGSGRHYYGESAHSTGQSVGYGRDYGRSGGSSSSGPWGGRDDEDDERSYRS